MGALSGQNTVELSIDSACIELVEPGVFRLVGTNGDGDWPHLRVDITELTVSDEVFNHLEAVEPLTAAERAKVAATLEALTGGRRRMAAEVRGEPA